MISSYLVILSLLLIALWNNEASGSDFSSRVSTTSLLHPSDSSFSNAIDISDVTDSRKITLQSVTNKIRTQKLPIFEFARELDQLLTVEEDGEAVSEWSAGQLYQQYVDALRDFYYQDFINRCEQHGQRLAWCEQRDIVMREAEVAMKTAMPSRITATLSYQVLPHLYLCRVLNDLFMLRDENIESTRRTKNRYGEHNHRSMG